MTEKDTNNKQKEPQKYDGINVELIDQWIAEHGHSREAILGQGGLLAQLTKAVVERALGAEMTYHLGYAKGEAKPEEADNCRNGYSTKKVLGQDRAVEIAVPRDRQGQFQPLLVPKGQKRFDGFDQKVIAM